ncbi:hypothetical protein IM098_004912 [Escherichia coli]|uniref:hypothetical protein n=1 Tax=Escherichia coli TaxID=562 RepID=UPI00066BD3B2|nr:hypothetical protein [Escherichia coli]APL01862.1 hypothetical protein RG56_00250 [Escherichia coli]APL11647.1 hypothetical protein RG58_00250 [Escherichia coli]APL24059.1 hypothetical protein RG60_15370 [Escherichia coli]APL29924.1 hypothetical protein RG61_19280 [Escherichia coli]APL34793.1 hypothetical protein RG62_19350 [Escherichia coli]
MKRNNLLNFKIVIWLLFFPLIGALLSICGVFIGYVVAYFKLGVFPIETIFPKIVYAIKPGVVVGLLLGLSLWIWGIVIPELTGKFKPDKKDDNETKK